MLKIVMVTVGGALVVLWFVDWAFRRFSISMDSFFQTGVTTQGAAGGLMHPIVAVVVFVVGGSLLFYAFAWDRMTKEQ